MWIKLKGLKSNRQVPDSEGRRLIACGLAALCEPIGLEVARVLIDSGSPALADSQVREISKVREYRHVDQT